MVYDPHQSKFVDMDVLGVLQIFGTADWPEYDTYGHGTIIISQTKMLFYMNMIMSQIPIESRFRVKLPNNLNGEVSTFCNSITLIFFVVQNFSSCISNGI